VIAASLVIEEQSRPNLKHALSKIDIVRMIDEEATTKVMKTKWNELLEVMADSNIAHLYKKNEKLYSTLQHHKTFESSGLLRWNFWLTVMM
jgi:hypothetical protein